MAHQHWSYSTAQKDYLKQLESSTAFQSLNASFTSEEVVALTRLPSG
jgi:hypothetical protein